jgi:hypothetical protein
LQSHPQDRRTIGDRHPGLGPIPYAGQEVPHRVEEHGVALEPQSNSADDRLVLDRQPMKLTGTEVADRAPDVADNGQPMHRRALEVVNVNMGEDATRELDIDITPVFPCGRIE